MFDFIFKKKEQHREEISTIDEPIVEKIESVEEEKKEVLNNLNYQLPSIDIIKNNNLKEFIKSHQNDTDLMIPLGLDQDNYYGESIASMPNLIVGGTVMSGKSSFIHTIIGTILLSKKTYEVKLMIYDSKMIEYSEYNGSPYLLVPVICDRKQIEIGLRKMTLEIDKRLRLLSISNSKDINQYNELLEDKRKTLPSYIIIMDDYDSIGNDNIDSIISHIAKNGRQVNIHLILVSSHPSSEIISSIAKSLIPARICFKVPSARDSMVILDDPIASKLSGIGKAFYKSRIVGEPKELEVQLITEDELNELIKYSKNEEKAVYDESWLTEKTYVEMPDEPVEFDESEDSLYDEVVEFVIKTRKASASILQRKFTIGYTRAANLIDLLEKRGIISSYNGSKPREVLVESKDD